MEPHDITDSQAGADSALPRAKSNSVRRIRPTPSPTAGAGDCCKGIALTTLNAAAYKSVPALFGRSDQTLLHCHPHHACLKRKEILQGKLRRRTAQLTTSEMSNCCLHCSLLLAAKPQLLRHSLILLLCRVCNTPARHKTEELWKSKSPLVLCLKDAATSKSTTEGKPSKK